VVAKISSSNTLYAALAYNQIKVDEKRAKVIFSNKMIENVDGNFNIHTCLKSFEPYLLANRRTEKPVLHVSLNPDPKDCLSDEQLSEIAQIYMQKMGYGEQPYIVYKHEDIERRHIHIVSLRVDENGRKIDHNFEHRRSMTVCRDLEKQFCLVAAEGKQRREEVFLPKPVNPEEGDVKHRIGNVIRGVTNDYCFLSFKEYKALLSTFNVGVEEVRGEVKGKQYRGLIYSALNGRGEKAGASFNSSLFGKYAGMENIEKRIETSAEIIKNRKLKERCKKVISAAIRSENSRAGFEKMLEKQGISVLFRENDEGRIYGVTFIDHNQKCVFNGSRLGKEFSANIFNDKFNLKQDFQVIDEIAKNSESKSCQSSNPENPGLDFGGIFDLFSPDSPTGDDIAEQDLIRHTRKKKKRQRKI